MSEEGKKFSFAFAKSIKKTNLQNPPTPEKKKVDYIECVDEQAIKIIGGEEKNVGPLVIPCVGKNDLYYQALERVCSAKLKTEIIVKQESTNDDSIESNKNRCNHGSPQKMEEDVVIKKDPDEPTLNNLAAQEILNDLKSDEAQTNSEKKVLTIPSNVNDNVCTEVSSLEDYDRVPIQGFGMAMLRGMGWTPETDKGINIKPPEIRPKGMGLGADKLAMYKKKVDSSKRSTVDDKLKWVKGSLVKVIAGNNSGSYGKVEGVDLELEKIHIKLELGGNIISENELWVQPVTIEEYKQDSRLLNANKIQSSKNGHVSKSKKHSDNNSDIKNKKIHDRKHPSDDSSDNNESRRNNSLKSREKRRRQSSEDYSSVERKSRKRRSDSSGSDRKGQRKKFKSSDDDSSSDGKSQMRKNNFSSSPVGRNKKKSKKKRHNSSEGDSSSERKSRRNRDTATSKGEKKKRKKSKKGKYSSDADDNDSTTEEKSKKQRNSRDEDSKEKKSKKSKKQKSRNSSSERLKRRKEKDEERSSYKKADCDSSTKSKLKSSRRSRSKSDSPSRSRRRARSHSYSSRR